MDIKIAIPSYGRADNVLTKKLFPDALVVVPESQKKEYEKNYDNVFAIPDNRDGNVVRKRNAILDLVKADYILMVDDDLKKIVNMNDNHALSGDEAIKYVHNGFRMMEEMGAGYFGFNFSLDPRRYKSFQPFSLTKPFYRVLGIKKDEIRFDESLFVGDVDYYLQKLRKYRRVFRYNFLTEVCGQFTNAGGVDYGKSEEVVEGQNRLIQKWGSKIVEIKPGKDNVKTFVHAPIKGV